MCTPRRVEGSNSGRVTIRVRCTIRVLLCKFLDVLNKWNRQRLKVLAVRKLWRSRRHCPVCLKETYESDWLVKWEGADKIRTQSVTGHNRYSLPCGCPMVLVVRRDEAKKLRCPNRYGPSEDIESGSEAPQTGRRKDIRTPRSGKRKTMRAARRMSAPLLVKLASRNNRSRPRNNPWAYAFAQKDYP